jgi:hypothetical protein
VFRLFIITTTGSWNSGLLNISMQLPPGPSYLLRSLPHFVLSSIIVYVCLTLAKNHLDLAVPTWLTVSAVIFARPALFIFTRYYSRFVDSRNAAANNAIIAPPVRDWVFSVMAKVSESFRNGYPGAF